MKKRDDKGQYPVACAVEECFNCKIIELAKWPERSVWCRNEPAFRRTKMKICFSFFLSICLDIYLSTPINLSLYIYLSICSFIDFYLSIYQPTHFYVLQSYFYPLFNIHSTMKIKFHFLCEYNRCIKSHSQHSIRK